MSGLTCIHVNAGMSFWDVDCDGGWDETIDMSELIIAFFWGGKKNDPICDCKGSVIESEGKRRKERRRFLLSISLFSQQWEVDTSYGRREKRLKIQWHFLPGQKSIYCCSNFWGGSVVEMHYTNERVVVMWHICLKNYTNWRWAANCTFGSTHHKGGGVNFATL